MEHNKHTVTETRWTIPAAEHARIKHMQTSGRTRAWKTLSKHDVFEVTQCSQHEDEEP